MTDRSGDVIGAMSHMKSKGTLRIVIIGFALGAILLLIGSLTLGDKNEKEDSVSDADNRQYLSFTEYKESVKAEIESTCLRVSGVQSAYAVVFFDSPGESKYAQNTQSGSQEKNEYVIIGSGSGAHALYLGESLPCVSGIGVVCDTGGSDSIKNEIAALLSATYGLPLTRIYVSEG